MYKSTFFILQSIHYLNHGEYAVTKQELLNRLDGLDCQVLANAMLLSAGEKAGTDEDCHLLFHWCQQKIQLI